MATEVKWLLCRALLATSLFGTIAVVGGEGAGARESRIRSILSAPGPPEIEELFSAERETVPVDYGGRHPFERELQSSRNLNEYQPIRIRFITDPLENRRGISAAQDAKIDTIINAVLPFVENSWSQHLSVYPVQSPISISKTSCFGFHDNVTPQEFFDNGIPEADLAILVSAQDVLTSGSGQPINFCPTHTLARAKACSLDQNERPVLGYINFCISGDKLQNEAQILDTSLVGVHEVGHILGMDSDLFLFFRDPISGEPRTPRPFEPRQVTCVDGSVRTTIFPSENTLKRSQTKKGLEYYDVVTPSVRTVVRNHFNCQSLAGARLENQPTSNSCSGNHWDERLFFSEVLSTLFTGAGSGHGAVLSPLSLALMEDSGWYKVTYLGSELSSYGHGMGCDFVHGDCIVNDKVPEFGKGVFCDTPVHVDENGQFVNNDTPIYCDPSHTKFGLCDLFNATVQPNPFGIDPLREDVRYFSDTSLTTVRKQGDFCPLPTIEIGVDCTDASADPARKFYAGEVYGPDSRCINAFADGQTADTSRVVLPACLPVVCDETSRKVIVGGQTCEFDYQILSFPTPVGHFFECPRLTTICPHLFCPAGCSGRGTCDYNANPPRCNCFHTSDTTAECSQSDVTVTSSTHSPVTSPPTTLQTTLPVPPPTVAPTVLPASTPPPTSAPTISKLVYVFSTPPPEATSNPTSPLTKPQSQLPTISPTTHVPTLFPTPPPSIRPSPLPTKVPHTTPSPTSSTATSGFIGGSIGGNPTSDASASFSIGTTILLILGAVLSLV